MFGVRTVIQTAPRICRFAVPKRTLVSGPPGIRIPFPEKVAHGLAIAVGVCATPLWVMHHLKDYRGATEENEDEE
ncbi:uncharacterized protein LOC110117245 [Athalia rosae]|uniref:uncharacterized protein LOC110117245 n=1 Tax=Athalia rosae TaxID=37344 RepID=UPI0020344FE5|nr:uncharacterized protein LOC110117245 [Athalia rosae]